FSLTVLSLFFFSNASATTEIYTLSLHDALPISESFQLFVGRLQLGRAPDDALLQLRVEPQDLLLGPFVVGAVAQNLGKAVQISLDRKSTRLNSSHLVISYAVFCLKKKNTIHPLI